MRKADKILAALLLLPAMSYAREYTPAPTPPVRGSVIANMLQRYNVPFVLYPYETNYLLYTWTSDINKESISAYRWGDKARKDEVKFQLSLAFPIWRNIFGKGTLLGASYTQRSWWQLSNSHQSSPFRETNYEPQIFLGWATNYTFAGWTLRDVEVGYNHQSNGRSDPTSRSWNRLYARMMAQRGNWQVEVKPWIKLHDSTEDNPDITDYVGHYRLKVGYAVGKHQFSAQGHYNWSHGYGNAELGWSYPITKKVCFYTQVFSGYGESLIDYNHKQTRFGIGITLNDIF